MFPEFGNWGIVQDGDPRLFALYARHYSYKKRLTPRRDCQMSLPGETLCLLTIDGRAGFIWVLSKYADHAGQSGLYCQFFRNEGDVRAVS